MLIWPADRYCDEPFPPYRFVPGQHPHPTAHPDGHSYEDGHPSGVTLIEPQDWATSTDYLYGADLYNHGYWWEAHEAWEGLWQVGDKQGTQGVFLKSLIQFSATHLNFMLGKQRGFDRLHRTSREYLSEVIAAVEGPRYMGLALTDFVGAVKDYYVQREVGQPHDPVSYPYVSLGSDE